MGAAVDRHDSVAVAASPWRYVRNLVGYPSVTEIKEAAGLGADYSDVSDFVLARAAHRGTALHDAIARAVEGREVPPIPGEWATRWAAFLWFLRHRKLETLLCEAPLYYDGSPGRACGTVDWLGLDHGRPVIYDWKFRYQNEFPHDGVQTEGYRFLLLHHHDHEVRDLAKRARRYVVTFSGAATPKPSAHMNDARDRATFVSALHIYHVRLAAGGIVRTMPDHPREAP